MIRERRRADLAPLCEVLTALEHPAAGSSQQQRLDWLTRREVEVAWVFDQAPVTVVPTGNVVGHVTLHRSTRLPAYDDVVEVGQLFVRPGPHQHGIARFLLTEAVAHVRRLGATAVLDLRDNVSVTRPLLARRGFVALDGVDGASGADSLFVHP